MTVSTLEDQRICIIGGTAGMGLAIAKQAALDDGQVVIAGRDSTKAKQIAATIGLNVEGLAIDLLDAASIESFFAALGEIDHLVVTASQVRSGPFRHGSVDDARATFEGKFWSQYLCARAANVRRSILLFSGILSRKPAQGMVAVGAVNGAVEALARSLAVELAPVRVNAISPGLIQGTDAYKGMPEDARTGMIAGAAGALPAGLVGDGDSVAGLACAVLASDYITGAIIDIDGGALII